MASSDIWKNIADERRALANDVERLTDDEWATASLCDGWSVRDVLAHMTATAEMTPATFLPKMIGSGFSLNKLSEKNIAARTKGSTADTLGGFKSRIPSKKHPPGPLPTWLGETIVHSEDIRRPLKIAHAYPAAALQTVADFYRGSNLVIGGKKRAEGLTLRATDADWSAGSGPEVTGPLISIVLALAGRKQAISDLSGEGKAVLEKR